MNGSCFFDTNIVIYCYTSTEPDKGKIARALVTGNPVISLQVIHEFTNALHRKFKKDLPEIRNAIEELNQAFAIHQNNLETAKRALEISGKHRLSFFDSLIIAAALEAGCEKLYSEDLHHQQVIDRRLTIINPFVEAK